MAFLKGKDVRVFWGEYDVSSYFSDYSAEQSIAEIETTTFTATAKTFLTGLREGKLSLNGYYDPTLVSGSDALLNTALTGGTAKVVSICNAGSTWAIGDRGVLASLKETKYNIKGGVGGAVEVAADGRADGGVDYCSCLHITGTAETSSTNSTGVESPTGAATTNGFAANLHATVCTSGTATIAIKGGSDNVTFGTTVTTFTALATTPTSEQKTGTGTVPRYCRAESTLASTPSYQYAVFLARR
jgi:hypothetical protein